MKNYRTYSDDQLYTAGSGHSIPVLGFSNLEVALKFELIENPGKVNTIIVHFKGVLHAPQLATKL